MAVFAPSREAEVLSIVTPATCGLPEQLAAAVYAASQWKPQRRGVVSDLAAYRLFRSYFRHFERIRFR
jgi:hypothetical protein